MERVEASNVSVLIERARNGDEAALNELLKMHSQRLLESIRGELGERLRQRLESQDVMQQVYLDALDSIDRFVDRGHDSFFAWLRRIALNRICDADRRQFKALKRRGEVRSSDLNDESMMRLLDQLAGSMTSPSRCADRAEQVSLLQRSLDRLTEDQREVLRLRYLHQLDVAQTAAKMDRSERAVRSLCVRALLRLREFLGDDI